MIPVQPSPYDVWVAQEVIDLIREASVFKENLKSVFVINRQNGRSLSDFRSQSDSFGVSLPQPP
jgi:hypothetical protein